ncbi:MAG: SDR family NAD(P)-dependent oxidoreductase [Solirubrobacteraceae bacterium]
MSRTVLITGATDGLGRALAGRAHRDGWAVLAHGRNEERLAALASELEGVRTFRADLASLAAVAALADEVGGAVERLDVLVNNAGIGFTEPGGGVRMESADGHELRFAVNYLAGYALTRHLLGLLRASAHLPRPEASPPAVAAPLCSRVVNVASAGQAPIDFADVMLTRGYDGTRAYAQSKLAQIMFMLDLAAEQDAGEVTANALHPGTYMPTKMVTAAGIAPVTPLDHGVEATWRLIADPALDGVSGRYFNGTRESRPHGQALDPDDRRALRELSERLTGA